MSHSELLRKQTIEMEGWISSAFERYLERDIHETTELLPPEAVNRFVADRRSYIQRYGDEFSRILHGDVQVFGVSLPKLRADLHKLMIRGCPALDIVERLQLCHDLSGHNACWTASRNYEDALLQLKQDLHLLSEQVSDLLNPERGMPHHLRQLLPERYKDQEPRMWQLVSLLPETIDCMAAMIGGYSPTEADEEYVIRKEVSLAYFYLLLKHFKLGFPTLSDLMRVSRQVSCTISSRKMCQNPVRRSRSAKPSKEHSKRTPGDSLSFLALQQFMHRFFKLNPGWKSSMSDDVTRCMSAEYDEHRARGEVFSDLLVHIDDQEPPRPASEFTDGADTCDLDKSATDTGGE